MNFSALETCHHEKQASLLLKQNEWTAPGHDDQVMTYEATKLPVMGHNVTTTRGEPFLSNEYIMEF